MIDKNNKFTANALFKAAEARDTNAVNNIINENPNAFDKSSSLLLLKMSKDSRIESIKFILETRPELVNIKDFFSLIKETNDLDTVKFLIDLKPEFINEATNHNTYAAKSDEKITVFDYICGKDAEMKLHDHITGPEYHDLVNIFNQSYTKNMDKMIMLIEAGAEPRIEQLEMIIQRGLNIHYDSSSNIISEKELKILGAVAQGLQNLAYRKDHNFINEKSIEYANILKESIDATLLRMEKVDDYRATDKVYTQLFHMMIDLQSALSYPSAGKLDAQGLTDTFDLLKSDIESHYESNGFFSSFKGLVTGVVGKFIPTTEEEELTPAGESPNQNSSDEGA